MRNDEINIEKLLAHPYINKAAIAKDLFPNQKFSKQTLNNKIKEVFAGTGRQRITEKDARGVHELFEKFIREIQ